MTTLKVASGEPLRVTLPAAGDVYLVLSCGTQGRVTVGLELPPGATAGPHRGPIPSAADTRAADTLETLWGTIPAPEDTL